MRSLPARSRLETNSRPLLLLVSSQTCLLVSCHPVLSAQPSSDHRQRKPAPTPTAYAHSQQRDLAAIPLPSRASNSLIRSPSRRHTHSTLLPFPRTSHREHAASHGIVSYRIVSQRIALHRKAPHRRGQVATTHGPRPARLATIVTKYEVGAQDDPRPTVRSAAPKTSRRS